LKQHNASTLPEKKVFFSGSVLAVCRFEHFGRQRHIRDALSLETKLGEGGIGKGWAQPPPPPGVPFNV